MRKRKPKKERSKRATAKNKKARKRQKPGQEAPPELKKAPDASQVTPPLPFLELDISDSVVDSILRHEEAEAKPTNKKQALPTDSPNLEGRPRHGEDTATAAPEPDGLQADEKPTRPLQEVEDELDSILNLITDEHTKTQEILSEPKAPDASEGLAETETAPAEEVTSEPGPPHESPAGPPSPDADDTESGPETSTPFEPGEALPPATQSAEEPALPPELTVEAPTVEPTAESAGDEPTELEDATAPNLVTAPAGPEPDTAGDLDALLGLSAEKTEASEEAEWTAPDDAAHSDTVAAAGEPPQTPFPEAVPETLDAPGDPDLTSPPPAERPASFSEPVEPEPPADSESTEVTEASASGPGADETAPVAQSEASREPESAQLEELEAATRELPPESRFQPSETPEPNLREAKSPPHPEGSTESFEAASSLEEPPTDFPEPPAREMLTEAAEQPKAPPAFPESAVAEEDSGGAQPAIPDAEVDVETPGGPSAPPQPEVDETDAAFGLPVGPEPASTPDGPLPEVPATERKEAGQEVTASPAPAPAADVVTPTPVAEQQGDQEATPGSAAARARAPRRAPKAEAVPTSERLQEAIAYYNERNYEDAIVAFNRLLKEEPGQTQVLALLGTAYLRNNMVEEAVATFTKLKQAEPDNVLAYENLGWIYVNLGEIERAAQEWEGLLRVAPWRQDIREKLERARCPVQLRERGKSQSQAGTDGAAEPSIARLLREGLQHLSQENYPAAVRCFQQWLRVDPRSKYAYKSLGTAYFNAGQSKEAQGAFEKALELDPQDTNALESLALIEMRNGNAQQARRIYQQILQLHPGRNDIRGKLQALDGEDGKR